MPPPKGVTEFAVNYGACGSGSGTDTRTSFRMKLKKNKALSLLQRPVGYCCYLNNPGSG